MVLDDGPVLPEDDAGGNGHNRGGDGGADAGGGAASEAGPEDMAEFKSSKTDANDKSLLPDIAPRTSANNWLKDGGTPKREGLSQNGNGQDQNGPESFNLGPYTGTGRRCTEKDTWVLNDFVECLHTAQLETML